ncbi:branched-chain amino acid transporter AzlD [Clostridium sartagoforme]|uniref:Branched-chain amino acid transporter AzlD n=1 Tax=Clostridium sartagoforme TaxID=84031 RepID=A0A4S2DH06_9CLOT|nr:AzlD domain-containing protein [Clostridium sartagoforme]TGY41377.1 branched-chain amino acid transporter AzlD [Clostridium sartagoforme]
MTLTPIQILITILMVVIGTMITRFLPFIIFKNHNKDNKYINYLGEVLPYAAIGLLVIYCLKNVSFTSTSLWLPEAIAIVCIIGLHYWKENTLLSIGAGTVIYMFLVQVIFI